MFILDVTNELKVLWECKHCAQMNEDDIIKFFSANEMKKGLLCIHCLDEFYVGMKLLDTRSPTLRAPVQPAIELLRRLRENRQVVRHLLPETLEKIDAVLKTAGGG